jgi:hypothetical protein
LFLCIIAALFVDEKMVSQFALQLVIPGNWQSPTGYLVLNKPHYVLLRNILKSQVYNWVVWRRRLDFASQLTEMDE